MVIDNGDGTYTAHVYPHAVNRRLAGGHWQRIAGALPKASPDAASPRTANVVTPNAAGTSQANVSSATWVEDSTPGNKYGTHVLDVGSFPTRDNAFIQFGLNSATSGLGNAYVTTASLALDTTYSASCTTAIPTYVSPVTRPWNAHTLAYFPGPSTAPRIGSSSWVAGVNCPKAPRAFHAISIDPRIVTTWLHGAASADYGLALTAPDASAENLKEFSADDAYLSLTFTPSGDGAAYTENTYASPWNNKTGWGQVTVRNEGSVTWGSNFTLGYGIYDLAGTTRTLKYDSTYPAKLPHTVSPSQAVTLTATLPALTPPASGHSWEVCWDMRNGATKFSTEQVPPRCYALPVINNAPIISSLLPANNSVIYSPTPALITTANDPDDYPGTGLSYTYNLYDTASATALKTATSTSPVYAVPTGLLKYGGVYYWTVAVSDSTATSATSAPNYFSIPSPAQPLITAHLGAAPYDNTTKGVDRAAGDYSTAVTDASIPGGSAGPPVAVTRTYNSLDPRLTTAFGAGWASTLDMRATPDIDGTGNVVVTLNDGREERFGKNADGTFSAPQGVKAWLVPYPIGSSSPTGYRLTDAQHSTYVFDIASSDPVTGQNFYGLDNIGGNGSAGYLTLGWEQTPVTGMPGTTLLPTSMYGPGTSHPRLKFSWSSQTITTSTGASVIVPHVASVQYALNPGQPSTPTAPSATWTYAYNAANQLTGVCSPATPDKCTQYTYTSGQRSGSHFAAMVNDSNPTNYWRLNDPAGATTATDSVAVNENSTAAVNHGAVFGSDGHLPGTSASTASFDGKSFLGLPQNLVKGNNVSFGMWFKTTQSGETLLSYANQSPDSATLPTYKVPALYVGTDGKLYGHVWDGATTAVASTTTVNDGNWHYASLSVEGQAASNKQTLYLDGVSTTRTDASAIDTSGKGPIVSIGAGQLAKWPAAPTDSSSDHGYFTGSISDVWFAQHPTGLPAVQQEYGAGTTTASELTTTTSPGGHPRVALTYDDTADRATKVTDADGGTWTIPPPTTTGSTGYYRGRVAATRPAYAYPLDESAGVSAVDAADDRAPDGSNDGTYNNVTLGEPGIFGPDGATAAGFDGKDSYVDLAGANMLFDESFTVALWFRTKTAGGTLLSMQDTPIGTTPTAHTALLYIGTDGKIHSSGYPSYPYPTPIAGKTAVNDGEWHLVELEQSVTDSNKEIIYLDGKVDASAVPYTVQYDYTQSYYSAGAGYTDKNDAGSAYATNTQGWFDGDIAEVGIYNHRVDSALAAGARSLFAARGSSSSLLPTTRVTVTDPNGNTETDDLDPGAGFRVIAHTDALGHTTRYAYDTRGFREATTDPNGHTTTLAHDAIGDVTTKVTCRDRDDCQKSTATYDTSTSATDYAAGKILTASDPRTYDGVIGDNTKAGYVTTWKYNAQGQISSVTEPATTAAPNGRVTSYTYTTSATPAADGGTQIGNQLATVTDANGSKTSYTYYSGGQVATITTPTGAVTKYDYTQDSYGPSARTVTDSSYPAGIKITYTYDAENRPLTVTDPQTTDTVTKEHHQLRKTYAYDDDGNVSSVTLTDLVGTDKTRTTTYAYSAAGHPASVTDANGNKTTNTYDSLGLLSSQARADGTTIGYAYSATGQLLTTTLRNYVGDANAPSAPTDLVLESRAYDPGGRLASITDAMGRTTSYHYLDDGLLSYEERASGTASPVQERWRYDAAGNATEHFSGCEPTNATPCLRLSTIYSDAANRAFEVDDTLGNRMFRVRGVKHDAVGNVTAQIVENADESASPAKISDPHQTTLTYDAGNNVTSSVTETGSTALTTTFARDTAGRLLSMTSPASRKTTYAYDEVGQLSATSKPKITDGQSGNVVTPTWFTGYDTFGEAEAKRDADGNLVSFAHDSDGNVTKITDAPYKAPGASDAVTPAITYAYDEMSRPISQSDPLGYRQSATYDQLGNVAAVTLPGGAKQAFTYDRDGEQLTSTSPTGARVEQTYNDLGYPITSTDDERYPSASANTTTYVNDRLGDELSSTDPLGNKTTHTYDLVQNRITTTLPGGEKSTTAYNSTDQPISVTAPDGTKSVSTLDEAGREVGTQQLSTTGTVLSSTGATYNGDGNKLTETDQAGHVVTSTYDADGNLARQSQPDGNGGTNATSFGYDAQGNRTSYTDPNGYTTTYTYNSMQKQESTILPAVAGDTALADRATTVAYDADGRPVTTTQPGGVSVTRKYNAAGELSQLTGTGAAADQRDYVYDADGRLTKATRGATTVTETYEDRGQVIASSDAGRNASMSYDAADNLRTRTDAAGTANFTYNADSNETKQVGPATSSTTDWAYNTNGQVSKTTYEGVASIAYGYDGQHRVTSEAVADPTGKSLTNYTYTRNAAGQVTTAATSCSSGCTANSTSYTYDGLGRLATSKTGTTTTSYGYDGNGNLTSSGGTTATYNEQNELTASTTAGGTTRYRYTARGTLDFTVAPNGTTTSSTFDAYDELTASGATTYTYDGLGRTASTAGQATNTFSYDGVGTEPVSDGSQTFGRTASGRPITSTSGGTSTDLVTNDHGDVLEQLSASGVAGASTYSPYGAATHTGSTRTSLGFEGGWNDPNGDVMTASRWYSPVLSRFLSADTQQNAPTPAVNANRYTYGNDDPLSRRDRSGHSACEDYEREAVEEAKARREEEQAEREAREWDREQARLRAEYAREDAELANERASEEAREGRELDREEERWDEKEFEEEHGGETRSEFEREVEYEEEHPTPIEEEGAFDSFLEEIGLEEAGESFGAEEGGELLLLLLLESYTNPSLGDCGSGAEPERVTPKNTEQRAQQGVQRAVNHPDTAPAEDPAAKAASEPKTFHPTESGDETTAQTATHDGSEVSGSTGEQDVDAAQGASPGDAVDDATMSDPVARGGVYTLRDEAGNVVRTGRTKDLAARESAHANDPVLGEYEFSIEYSTDVYGEQRGLEQMLYDRYPGAQAVNGGLNKIRAISPRNPSFDFYVRSALEFLGGGL